MQKMLYKGRDLTRYILSSAVFFFNFWLCWVFVAALDFLWLVASGGCFLVAVPGLLIMVASHHGGFPCCRARALGRVASVVVAGGL